MVLPSGIQPNEGRKTSFKTTKFDSGLYVVEDAYEGSYSFFSEQMRPIEVLNDEKTEVLSTDKKMNENTKSKEICIVYTNWKGETAIRRIIPSENGLKFESNQYHPIQQWLLHAYDVDKQAERTFAIKDIRAWF